MIGQHLNILSGFAFKSSHFNSQGKGMPIIRIRDVGQSKSSTFYDGEYDENYVIRKGDFLVGMDGEFRLAEWKGPDSLLNQRVCKIEPDSTVIDRRYFYHMLPAELKRIEDTTSFVTVKHLSVKKIKEIEIPLPPLATQKKIAEILDAADAHRQKTKQLLAKYDELAQSIFLEMFGDPVTNPKGWEIKKLEELVSKLGDGIHGTPRYTENGPYFFINGNNLNQGRITIDSKTKTVSAEEYEKHKRELNSNTVLVSINGTIGKIAFYNGESIMLGKSACYFNLKKESVNKMYLYHIIDSPYFIKYASNQATGSTIKNVSLKSMRNLPIPFPPISHQNESEERIDKIQKQREMLGKGIDDAENLFNSLLQKAFKGEL